MSKLIDTNVAIFIADRRREISERIATFDRLPSISLITLAELEGGVHAQADLAPLRRGRLDVMLKGLEVVAFGREVVAAYADIVAASGFSRRRVLDRLIAATAIVHDLTLVTCNGPDFQDIPGLTLEVWPTPAQ